MPQATPTNATPSESKPGSEVQAAPKKQSKPASSEILLIFDPSQDPAINVSSFTFISIEEASLGGEKTQQIPIKVELEPGLNIVTREVLSIVMDSQLAHVKQAIARQALREMESWDDAPTRERRDIVRQCNNPKLLPLMRNWLEKESNAVVKADLEIQVKSLEDDRPDPFKPTKALLSNAA